MKEINKQKYDERIKDAKYVLSIEFDEAGNTSTILSARNNEGLNPDNMTDEDAILLLQLAMNVYDEIMKLNLRRNLLPEELEQMEEMNDRLS